MLHESESLRDRLERATSRTPSGELDRETASLREGWVALCDTLAASDTAWDDRVLVQAMAREERAARRAAGWSLAMALSLVGIVVGAFAWLDRLAQDTAQHVAHVAMTRTPEADWPGKSVGGTPSTDGAATREWNDELDRQLIDAQETLVSIRAAWGESTDRVGLLSERLEELRSEFDGEAL